MRVKGQRSRVNSDTET